MKLILRCLFILALSVPSYIFAGTNYYVDATSGADTNTGLSPQDAWRTIERVNSQLFFPGDSILFKRGEEWRENLIIPSSGISGDPIIFGAFGSGPNPIINGADILRDWIYVSGQDNVWQTSLTVSAESVYFNGIRGTKKSSLDKIINENDWHWENNILYIYSASDPNAFYTNPGIECATEHRGIGIDLNDKSFILVDGLTIEKLVLTGIDGDGSTIDNNSDFITIKNCTIQKIGPGTSDADATGIGMGRWADYWLIDTCIINDVTHSERGSSGGAGIYIGAVYTSRTAHPSTNNTIKNCLISDTDTGITMKYDSIGNTISQNIIHDCLTYGIVSVGNANAGNTITRNLIYDVNLGDDGDIAIEVFNHTTVSYNIIYDSFNGIFINSNSNRSEHFMNSGDHNDIYNNSIYDCITGLVIWNTNGKRCKHNNINNNLVYEGILALRYPVNQGAGTDSNNINNNCYFDSDNLIFRVGKKDKTFTQWISWVKDDSNSINSNPLLMNPVLDFTLQAASPCIDAGTYVGLSCDYPGNIVPYGGSVDIGACEYTPNSPVLAKFNAPPTPGSIPLTVYFAGKAMLTLLLHRGTGGLWAYPSRQR